MRGKDISEGVRKKLERPVTAKGSVFSLCIQVKCHVIHIISQIIVIQSCIQQRSCLPIWYTKSKFSVHMTGEHEFQFI